MPEVDIIYSPREQSIFFKTPSTLCCTTLIMLASDTGSTHQTRKSRANSIQHQDPNDVPYLPRFPTVDLCGPFCDWATTAEDRPGKACLLAELA
jgi:hypothetical protein